MPIQSLTKVCSGTQVLIPGPERAAPGYRPTLSTGVGWNLGQEADFPGQIKRHLGNIKSNGRSLA